MASNFSFNPALTTNVQGSFSVESTGFVQGTMMDDPTVRNLLSGGILATTETLPMWGGVGIFEDIPNVINGTQYPAPVLGPTVGRASTLANLTGFSVFNQAVAWITSPQSEAPSAGANMTVPFFRLGSNARIAVQMDPALVSLNGGLTTQNVSWDFNQQRLIPYYPTTGNVAISAMSWASTNGGTVSVTTASAHNLSVGSDFTISGAAPTAYNGDWTVATTGSTTTLTFLLPASVSPGAVTTLGQVNAGGGALNVRVLETKVGNCKTITYDAVNNLVHWNANGSCALILI